VAATVLLIRVEPGALGGPSHREPDRTLAVASATATAAPTASTAAIADRDRDRDRTIRLSDPRQSAQIETTPAASAPIPLTQPLAARLAYDQAATSQLTVPIDGRVVRLVREIGDRVKAGEPILEIDSPDLGQALADAAKARADADLKRTSLARVRDLYDHQVVARKELEAAQADQAQANAELERTELRLRNLNAAGRVRGQTFTLSSPIAGLITERNATVGQQVLAASGNVLATVTDPSRLMLLIDVPESLAGALSIGTPIDFTVDGAPGRTFHARVERIAPQVDTTTRRVQVRARVDNRDGALRPEMFAQALPSGMDGQTATRVPASALLQFGARTIAYVAIGGDAYQLRDVDVATQQGGAAWVRSGIQPGERVVSAGALLLKSEQVGQ